jgi:hypothetical protein
MIGADNDSFCFGTEDGFQSDLLFNLGQVLAGSFDELLGF